MADDAVRKITHFRINNPEYFIVLGNIINNALCNYIHQRIGALDLNIGEDHNLAYKCMDAESWSKGVVASHIHKAFLQKKRDGRVYDYVFNKWILAEYERFSINFMAWFGHDFASFDGKVGFVHHGHPLWEEEPWLTEWKPREIGRPNCIFGGSIAAHFSFYPQREYLEDATDILDIYRELAYEKV